MDNLKFQKEHSFKIKINLSTPWGRWHLGELFASTPWEVGSQRVKWSIFQILLKEIKKIFKILKYKILSSKYFKYRILNTKNISNTYFKYKYFKFCLAPVTAYNNVDEKQIVVVKQHFRLHILIREEQTEIKNLT